MSLRSIPAYSVAALAGAAMLALSSGPASALTLSGPSLAPPAASAHVDKVYYRGGYRGGAYRGGYHRGYAYRGGYRGGYAYHGGYRGYGYGGAAIVGGAAAGLAAGAALAAPHCWVNAYGTQVCN